MNHIDQMKRRLLARSRMKWEARKKPVESAEVRKRENRRIALLLDSLYSLVGPLRCPQDADIAPFAS